jgi:fructose-1,6-bisphosphatase/inositol monophosphatase family enzyme
MHKKSEINPWVIRVLGCAGLDFIAILKGTQIGYVSSLSPWDYAAGTIMMELVRNVDFAEQIKNH